MATLQECQRRHDYAMADLTEVADRIAQGDDKTLPRIAITQAQKAFADLRDHHDAMKASVRKALEETA